MPDSMERGIEIIDAVLARLAIPTDPDEIAALPARMQALATELAGLVVDGAPLRPGEGTRIRVYPWEALPTLKTASIASHGLLLKIELMRLIEDELRADQALAPLYVWAIRRLLTAGALSGMATKIEEGKRLWRAHEGEQAHALMILEVRVTYQTRVDDPEARN